MNYGVDPAQYRDYVVRPALQYIGLGGRAAEQLVLGTCLKESNLRFIKQIGAGPALGFPQIEPATYNDIYINYLRYRPELREKVDMLRDGRDSTLAEELIYNLPFAVVMARLKYYRAPAPLPIAGDAYGMVRYWKEWYNTAGGAGDIDEALPHFKFACVL